MKVRAKAGEEVVVERRRLGWLLCLGVDFEEGWMDGALSLPFAFQVRSLCPSPRSPLLVNLAV